MRRGDYRNYYNITNYYRTHGQNQGGGWRPGMEVGSAGVGWRDGEKRHTTVIE